MRVSQKLLLVVINPFAVPLNHKGQPVTVVQYDPEESGGATRFIGTTFQHETLKKRPSVMVGKQRVQAQQDRIAATPIYDLSPQKIVDTTHHRQSLRDGSLLPADAATARLVGIPFEAPEIAMARSRDERIAEWVAQHEEPPAIDAWEKQGIPQAKTKAQPQKTARKEGEA
jgi:hypothetical protein